MVLKNGILLLGFIGTFLSCTSASTESVNENDTTNEKPIATESLYNLHCEACHGMDGTKGISGAANLKISKMTDRQIKETIENGNDKGMMPFKDIIQSESEIDSLVSFVKTLRK